DAKYTPISDISGTLGICARFYQCCLDLSTSACIKLILRLESSL
ncbi:21905_t:CDS:1, partial [Gigaspora rosea]